MPTLARSTYLESEVITGRGVAEPPSLNIETYHGNNEEYYYNRPRHSSDSYSAYRTNNNRDIYSSLREKLNSNHQMQKYIVSLKEQLRRNQSREQQRLMLRDYSRAGTVPRGRLDSPLFPSQFTLLVFQSRPEHGGVLPDRPERARAQH